MVSKSSFVSASILASLIVNRVTGFETAAPAVPPCDKNDKNCLWSYMASDNYGYYEPASIVVKHEGDIWVKPHTIFRKWHGSGPITWNQALAEKASATLAKHTELLTQNKMVPVGDEFNLFIILGKNSWQELITDFWRKCLALRLQFQW
jgi:hypothetical protein